MFYSIWKKIQEWRILKASVNSLIEISHSNLIFRFQCHFTNFRYFFNTNFKSGTYQSEEGGVEKTISWNIPHTANISFLGEGGRFNALMFEIMTSSSKYI